jgi:hypothetical protein
MEAYSISQDRSQGLTNVSIDRFTRLIRGGADDDYTTTSIGFDFQPDASLDGVTIPPVYDRLIISVNGWVALVGKGVDLSTPTAIKIAATSVIAHAPDFYDNTKIYNAAFTGSTSLLCPWFDDLYTPASTPSEYFPVPSGNYLNLLTHGMYPWPTDMVPDGGVWIRKNDVHPTLGERTIIRWVCMSTAVSSHAGNLLRFECVLYANGRYEFRYDQLGPAGPSGSVASSATAGAFFVKNRTSGAPYGPTYFREPIIQTDVTRSLYTLGGHYYTGWRDPSSNVFYRTTLTLDKHWPGTSCYAFLPPTSLRRVLPRQAIRDLDNVSNDGFLPYDDRNTVAFTSGTVVCFPTSLPRFHGNQTPGIFERQNVYRQSL